MYHYLIATGLNDKKTRTVYETDLYNSRNSFCHWVMRISCLEVTKISDNSAK